MGTLPGGSGSRNDLQLVKRSLDEGLDDLQIANEHFGSWVRYHKSFQAYRTLHAPKRGLTDVTAIRVCIGASGLGKTHFVLENSPEVYVKPLGKWWDLFKGTEDVLFDDFHGGIEFRELLRLANPGPYSVENKGGVVNFSSKTLWITSNIPPDQWYSAKVGDHAPLLRRIRAIYHFIGFKEYALYESDPEHPVPGSTSAWDRYVVSENYLSISNSISPFLNE